MCLQDTAQVLVVIVVWFLSLLSAVQLPWTFGHDAV